MANIVDVRCYITPAHKKQIKTIAFERGISVSRLLKDMLCREIPDPTESPKNNNLVKGDFRYEN